MVQNRDRNLKSSGKVWLTALGLTLIIAQAALAQGLSADEASKLKLIEQNLFFKNYDDDQMEARLARIEKRVFGEAAEGSLSARMANILQVAKPLEKAPVQKERGSASQSVRQPTPEQQQQDQQAQQEDAADRARQRAMAARDQEVNQMFTDAVRLWKERKAQEAQEKFEQVVRMAPDNAEAQFSLGVIYEAQHNYTAALESYKHAVEIEPGKREYKEAVSLIEKKAAGKEQDDSKKLELRTLAENASGAYRRGEFISALDLYKQLDRKAPNQDLVKYNIGTIYLAMKSPVQALEFFRQARKLKPENPNYQKAVSMLEGNLETEQSERLKSEQAWQNQPQNSGQNSGSPVDTQNKKSSKKQKNQPNSNQNQNQNQQQFQQPQQQFGQNQQQFQQPQQQFNQQQFGQNQQQFQQPQQQFGQNQQQFQQPQQQFNQQQNQQQYGQAQQQYQPQQQYQQPQQQQQAVFMQQGNGNGLLGGDKNAPAPSSAFGILAKSNKQGVLVTTIGIASRAGKSGLQKGDVIRAVDGVVIKGVQQFQEVMGGKRPGQSIQLLIERKGNVGQVIL